MILQERYLLPKYSNDIFKLIAEELSENINTQIIICNDILKKLRSNHYYNVSFHNNISISGIDEWYILHKSNAFSLEISRLEVRPFGNNYSQVTKFHFDGYSFSNKNYNLREYNFWQNEIERFLVIKLQ